MLKCQVIISLTRDNVFKRLVAVANKLPEIVYRYRCLSVLMNMLVYGHTNKCKYILLIPYKISNIDILQRHIKLKTY